MKPAAVTFADRVRPGDEIKLGEVFVRIAAIRRARGRKPKVGENLDFVTDSGAVAKLNSTAPVRVRRAQ